MTYKLIHDDIVYLRLKQECNKVDGFNIPDMSFTFNVLLKYGCL